MSWSLDDWNVTENWVKTYPAGRVCDHDGCATILSRYNAGATCEMHKPAPDFTHRHGFTFRACDTCGRLEFISKAFRKIPDGHSTTCLGCERKQAKRADKAALDEALTDTLLFGSKYCRACCRLKPRSSDYFGRDIHQDDGLNRECKACRSARGRERYANDPELREKRKAHSRKAAS